MSTLNLTDTSSYQDGSSYGRENKGQDLGVHFFNALRSLSPLLKIGFLSDDGFGLAWLNITELAACWIENFILGHKTFVDVVLGTGSQWPGHCSAVYRDLLGVFCC